MTKHKYSTTALIAIIAILLGTYAIAELDTNDIDSICNTENSILQRNSNNWYCGTTINLESPNGTIYNCGVNNTGQIICN